MNTFVWLSIGHRLADTNRCQLTNIHRLASIDRLLFRSSIFIDWVRPTCMQAGCWWCHYNCISTGITGKSPFLAKFNGKHYKLTLSTMAGWIVISFMQYMCVVKKLTLVLRVCRDQLWAPAESLIRRAGAAPSKAATCFFTECSGPPLPKIP